MLSIKWDKNMSVHSRLSTLDPSAQSPPWFKWLKPTLMEKPEDMSSQTEETCTSFRHFHGTYDYVWRDILCMTVGLGDWDLLIQKDLFLTRYVCVCLVFLTFSSSVLSGGWPGLSVHETELSAHHLGSIYGEVIIAHCAPLPIVENLHSPFVVFALLPS